MINPTRNIAIAFIFLAAVFSGAAFAETTFPRKSAVVLAVEKVSPAVVNISTEELVQRRPNPFSRFQNDFFGNFFDNFFESSPRSGYKRQSLGSGVIINSEGYILTNEHVVSRASKIKVTLSNGNEYEAHLIGADSRSDLAAIKIETKEKFPFIKMGHSDDLMIGETVIAIGNPFGLSHTVTTGVISAASRSLKLEQDRTYQDFIQIDAPINPGNSGGPLLNINGELIGINTAIYQQAEGIGFAIPIDKARRIVDALITYGEAPEAWLGIFVENITSPLAKSLNYQKSEGVLISKISKGSPAEKTGLKPGDIILSLGKHKIKSADDYHSQMSTFTLKNRIELSFWREGKKKTIFLVAQKVPSRLALEITKDWLGFSVSEITRKKIKKYHLFSDEGVVVIDVERGEAADDIGIKEGDLVRRVNRSVVKNLEEFKKAILLARRINNVLLLVQRGRHGYYVNLEP